MGVRSVVSALIGSIGFIGTLCGLAPSALALPDYSGYYQLTRGVYGFCEGRLSVYDERAKNNLPNVYVGSRIFSNIDRGTIKREDDSVREVQKTVSTKNSLSEVDYTYNKALKATYVYRLSARFSNNGKTMTFRESNSVISQLPTSCVYRRLPKSTAPVVP